MIAIAPGKLFVTGAYAVLEGAPAIVAAVDRFVVADTSRDAGPSVRAEVAAVAELLEAAPPYVDASALEDGGRKLGLGSSAAAAVAATAAIIASRGDDLAEPSVIDRIRRAALAAHARSQPHGSGGDVAAAAHGGVVRVQRQHDQLAVASVKWPSSLVIKAYATPRSARTSDVLDRLHAHRHEQSVQAAMTTIHTAARDSAVAFDAGDADAIVVAGSLHVRGLAHLGDALGLALVPAEVVAAEQALANFRRPSREHGEVGRSSAFALVPSGAGGGDVVLWLGTRTPSGDDESALLHAGLTPLSLTIATHGTRTLADTAVPSTATHRT